MICKDNIKKIKCKAISRKTLKLDSSKYWHISSML
jgi:hypothetical protein